MDGTSQPVQQIFRPRALQRQFSSPQRLDELVDVTVPFDWLATIIVWLILIAVCLWCVLGRIPTRVSGEGILLGGGKVTDAVSVVEGRLASVEVAVGDRVAEGQVLAHIAQTEADQRYRGAQEVVQERERDYAELLAAQQRETVVKTANITAQLGRLGESIQLAQQRATYLDTAVSNLKGLLERGFATVPELDQRRTELNAEHQRIADARTEIERLNAQKIDLEAQHERERLAAQARINDAHRQMQELQVALSRDSELLSPSSGHVIELKVSKGAVLKVGTPMLSIETDGKGLQAMVYVAATQAKKITPGMSVRLAPATVRREEVGTLMAVVTRISEYPVTPEGMAALLHNDTLVTRFGRAGPPHTVEVALQRDPLAVSGYRWSSGGGPSYRLTPGTLVAAEITVREQRPISLIMPWLKRSSGVE